MASLFSLHERQYDRVEDVVETPCEEKPQPAWLTQTSSRLRPFLTICSYLFVAALAFGAGFLSRAPATQYHSEVQHGVYQTLHDVAPRIPLPLIRKKFVEKSDFLQEPPLAGNESEPIWDELIPS